MNKTSPSSEQRAICPACGTANTFAQYQHPGCPSSPAGMNVWTREAWLGPDGRPVNLPCPDCQDGIPRPPAYLFCKNCQQRWNL